MALLPAASLAGGPAAAADRDDTPPDTLIGYTEHRTDLPGGRHANVKTRRAVVVKADGTGRRVLAEELTREEGSWTEFGWSPDGKAARLSRTWKSEEIGKWEEEHKDFRTTGDGVRHDIYLVDLASGKATKQIAVEEKTSAFIKNLVHGRSTSPDGKRSAFEDPGYRLYLADADGSNARQIKTGLRFHLMPSWSPDGSWVLFVAGEQERTADREASGVDALPPGGFARRQVAGLRIEARWRPPAVRDALERQEGVAHHRPQEGARRHVGELAAPRRAVMRGPVASLSGQHCHAYSHLVRPDGSGLCFVICGPSDSASRHRLPSGARKRFPFVLPPQLTPLTNARSCQAWASKYSPFPRAESAEWHAVRT
jgi:hypothetical protein